MLPVTLCLDFGNSRLKTAIFYGDKLIDKVVFEKEHAVASLEKLIQFHNPTRSILSSVIHHSIEIEALLKHGSKQKFVAKRYGTTEANLSCWLKKHNLRRS